MQARAKDRVPPFSARREEPTPPKFTDAGLPEDFDLVEHEAWRTRRERLGQKVIWACFLVFNALYLGWLTAGYTRVSENVLSTLSVSIVLLTALSLTVSSLGKKLKPDEFERSYRRYKGLVYQFDQARNKWNDCVKETGLGYWREKRGVALEEAVRDFFLRRNCTVRTTKASGDGGVDLIISAGQTTFWCQCKGHASPISVAVVREIAGVCSRGRAVPMVVAVNGYTGPAMGAARELGVLLIDAPLLVNLAKEHSLADLIGRRANA